MFHVFEVDFTFVSGYLKAVADMVILSMSLSDWMGFYELCVYVYLDLVPSLSQIVDPLVDTKTFF